MRDLPQNFVEGVSKRGNRRVRQSRARLLPLLQRVEFLDTLRLSDIIRRKGVFRKVKPAAVRGLTDPRRQDRRVKAVARR